jgi:integral membrane protein
MDHRRILGIRCVPLAAHSNDADEGPLDAAAGQCSFPPGPDGALDGASAYLEESLMSELGLLRWITFLEGISYLVLLFVAMPLKYLFEIPMAVRIAGGVHGLLFVSYTLALYQERVDQRWSTLRTLHLLVVSLIPGSLFWLDRRIRKMGELTLRQRR